MTRLRLGTRGSRLALIQSELVAERLRARGVEVDLVTVVTQGDVRPPDAPIGEGIFVTALERALIANEIDLAVHSAKDVPLDEEAGLEIAAYPERADPRDALVARNGETSIDALPHGARVGTDSPRRAGFVRAIRPDLNVIPIHGNVDTRVRRLDDGEADALVLAAAGLDRLGLGDRITARLDPELVPPAPGQGALAVQVRRGDQEVLRVVRPLDDRSIRLAVLAERALLKAMGGGCRAPVGSLAEPRGEHEVDLIAGAVAVGGSPKYVFRQSIKTATASGLSFAICSVAIELKRRTSLRLRAVLDTRPELELHMPSEFRHVHVPTVAFEPVAAGGDLDRARRELGSYDWVVLTSKRGVDALFNGIEKLPEGGVRWAAVGSTTARALSERGVHVDCVPADTRSEAIPGAMAELSPLIGSRVLLARADAADDSLPESLRVKGAEVDDVVAYKTVVAPAHRRDALLRALADPELEAIIFASGSAVRGLVELAGAQAEAARHLLVFTIGPKTSAAARHHGFKVTAEAKTQDTAGLISAVNLGFQEEVTRWVDSQFPRLA